MTDARRQEDVRRLRVVGARPGVTVEVAPGQKVAPLHLEDIEEYALCELVPQGDGTVRPVARVISRWVPISQRNLRRLGIQHSQSTLQRLIRAGFVRGRQPSPRHCEFDLVSYLEHLERCEDPEFWTERRLMLYKQSI